MPIKQHLSFNNFNIITYDICFLVLLEKHSSLMFLILHSPLRIDHYHEEGIKSIKN